MTSAPISPASSVHTTAPAANSASRASDIRPLRLTLTGVIRSEWIKAMSLRSIRWTLAISIALGVAMSAIMGVALRNLPGSSAESDPTGYLLTVTGFPATFLALIFGVLGVFIFSSEYASGMILSTLTASPRRGLVLAAKALILTAISGVAALIVVAAATGIAVVLVPGVAEVLGNTQVITGIAGTLLFLVAVSLLAFAVAGIVRSTAGAITIVVALLLLVPMLLQVLANLVDWTWIPTAQNYLPMTLGSTLGNGFTDPGAVSLRVEIEQADTGYSAVPTYWQAATALVVWVAVPMLAAARLFFARDAK